MHTVNYSTKQGMTARPSETLYESEEDNHSIAHEHAVDCDECYTFTMIDEDGEAAHYSTDTGRRI